MKTCTTQRTYGIQWTLWTQLEDMDFANDLALLFHSHQHMHEKTCKLAAIFSRVYLDVHKGKIKVLKINTVNTVPVT